MFADVCSLERKGDPVPKPAQTAKHPPIAWAPRSVLAGRTFRLAVADPAPSIHGVEAPDFTAVASRRVEATWIPGEPGGPWARRSALFTYLRAPTRAGVYQIAGQTVTVLGMPDLLGSGGRLDSGLPRRWRVGAPWESTKTARTMDQEEPRHRPRHDSLDFWLTQPDAVLWKQLPPAEIPKAHFVNEHRGCPVCGTRVFRHGGFYPWRRSHLPCTFRSTCPSCSSSFPSNSLAEGDFTTGPAVDDGYGMFDDQGRLYLFAATYHRDQVRAYSAGIAALTDTLRRGPWDDEVARRLGLLLARYAVEELYVAAAPQFRYGPSRAVEEPWPWGQEDWMGTPDPVASLAAKGTLHYSIDTPSNARLLALAFDTVWPFLRADEELADRVRACGLAVQSPREVADLVEQMLACLLQCILDFGARSNLPEESLGALSLLLALDRPDAQDVMDWLYLRGPDRLGVFCVNDFLPDGSPPEATGGYNSIHTNGLFALEHEIRRLRARHPAAYPEQRFPSVLEPARAARCILQPHELTVVGRSWFQFGDGSAPGTSSAIAGPEARTSLLMEPEIFEEPLLERTWRWARDYVDDPDARAAADAVLAHRASGLGTTVHDRVGIAILRTAGAPERAALGMAYGDASGHRHMDLGDVQLFAFGRPFLTDLGYPQSWASIGVWEAHWATHNTAWAIDPAESAGRVAGRGRIVTLLAAPGVQVLDVEMDRWARSAGGGWRRLEVRFRRLLALVETDGDGIAVIDLSRARGGVEHWRICRGLEGSFGAADDERPASRAPSGAGARRERTVLDALAARGLCTPDAPDYQAFAFMDDAKPLETAGFRGGIWRSSVESGVSLDLHHLGSSPGTEIWNARATQSMGTPEESLYSFRTLLWRRVPEGPLDTSAVDLVLEPRVSGATLASARRIGCRSFGTGLSSPGAAGVELCTHGGRRVCLYWSPWATPDEKSSFDDGARLRGPLMVEAGGKALHAPTPQRLRIVRIDRGRNQVEVSGEVSVATGSRVRCDRDGVGFSYLVREVGGSGELARLTLDVSSVLGVSTVAAVGDGYVDLVDPLMTRTGFLTGARLSTAAQGDETVLAQVVDAAPIEGQRTRLWLRVASRMPEAGERVCLADYSVGDALCT